VYRRATNKGVWQDLLMTEISKRLLDVLDRCASCREMFSDGENGVSVKVHGELRWLHGRCARRAKARAARRRARRAS